MTIILVYPGPRGFLGHWIFSDKIGTVPGKPDGWLPYLSWTGDVGRVESCSFRSVGVAVMGEGKRVESFEHPHLVPKDSGLALWARASYARQGNG